MPCTRAVLEANRGHPERGIDVLRTASPYEFGGDYYFIPIYVRGLTYLRAREGREAAAEFQRILDHRALGAVAPAYALLYWAGPR